MASSELPLEHADHPALAAEHIDYAGVKAADSHLKGDEGGPGVPGDLAAIKRFLDVESRINTQDEGKLREILRFAQNQGIDTDDELSVWLKKLTLQLGTPELGMSRVSQLINYLDLDERIERLSNEQRSYIR